jgi:hypothetical protein
MSATILPPVTEQADHRPATRSTARAAASRLPAWAREPLLHFLLLGAVLFAVDALLVSREEDPNRIVVGPEVDAEARQAFKAARGRDPDAAELQALRQVWLDNEVLYREGIALGLDRGDKAIRERVIFKALSMVDAGTQRPQYDEAALRAWFEKNHARYDEPQRFNFQEAVLAGDSNEGTVRAFAQALNAGGTPEQQAGLRVFKDRPRDNLLQSYGEQFVDALATMTPGTWQAVNGRDGWRAVQLQSVLPAIPADFEALRNVVQQDWTDAELSQQRSDAVRKLAEKYSIEMPQ